MKTLGIFVPARLQSERLPNKMIKPLGDTCLFEIACRKLEEINQYYPAYVLIYEQELIDIASKYNVHIIKRSRESAILDDPILTTMGDIKEAKEDYLMFLNPCLPFLSTDAILRSLSAFQMCSGKTATSVIPFHNWVFDRAGNDLLPIDYSSLNTKAIYGLCTAAHCFHIFNKNDFLKTGKMLEKGHDVIEVPSDMVIDVDTPEDFEYVEYLWNKRGGKYE